VGQYHVILADPPWAYTNGGVQGGVDHQYPTMTNEELAALPVASIAAPDSVLLLWGTWPKLAESCLPTMETWGFRFVTGFPWIKITEFSTNLWGELEMRIRGGIGFWVRGVSEMVLIGRRGNPTRPPLGRFVGLLSPNLYHSRKPDSLYEYAEAMPGPYCELFARRRRDGWDSWGLDLPPLAPPPT